VAVAVIFSVTNPFTPKNSVKKIANFLNNSLIKISKYHGNSDIVKIKERSPDVCKV